ncbi:MAG: lysophospholipid acyltransferase family protein, partial [Oscillospiraceae bacterium]
MKPLYFYRFWRDLIGFFGRIIHRIKVVGIENIPAESHAIIASSHVHAIDPMLHGYMLSRDMFTMAKAELFNNPLFGAVLRKLGAFPVTRGHGDRGAIKVALNILNNDGLLLVFPEGTRSKNGELGAFKTGAVMFSVETNSPVIPATIIADRKLGWFKPVTIIYGEPIS